MEPFVGQICLFGFNFIPVGWAACDGQLLAINSHQALFALIGTTYGGDGSTNFALPTYSVELVKGESVNYCIALNGIFPPRS